MRAKYFLLLNQILMPLFWALSYLVPKQQNLHILGCKDKKIFTGNPKYMFLYLSSRPELDVYFITTSESTKKLLAERKLKTSTGVMHRWYLLLRANYIYIDHSIYDVADFPVLFGKFNIVQLYHGTPYKKIENDSRSNHWLYYPITRLMGPKYSLITCNDPATRKNYQSAFRNNHVQILGFPRNDIFFDAKLKTECSFEKLNYLKDFSRVFLYAPTWRDYTLFKSFSADFLKRLDDYCKKENILFLIKQHPHNQQLKIPKIYQNVLDISKSVIDAQELLWRVDLLIADYSSIVFDFALTNKPILFYVPDFEEYSLKNREAYFEYKDIFPGPFVYSEDELMDKLLSLQIWQNKEDNLIRYQEFRNRFNTYQDSESSKRIYEYLQK